MLLDTIVTRRAVDKGWSGDRKFHVTTQDGSEYLLRLSPIERKDRKSQEFRRMQQVASLEVPMCLPIEFGICEEGVYSLQSWIHGIDAEGYISALPTEAQHAYGLDAGRILKTIHTLPAPADIPDWEARFGRKMDKKLANYMACPLKYENDECILRHLADNRHLLANRPQCYQHGDYHIGNMMVDKNGLLTIIDFDRDDYGDPWQEFNRIVWCAQAAPAFASGMVDGYFDGNVPMEFWRLLALYICNNALSSLPWAIPFGEGEIAVMRKQTAEILGWYDGMKTVIPGWYRSRR